MVLYRFFKEAKYREINNVFIITVYAALYFPALFSNSFIIHQVKTRNFKTRFLRFYFSVYSLVFVSIEKIYQTLETGRRGGLMVSALGSGSNGPGSSPGRGTALCSWARRVSAYGNPEHRRRENVGGRGVSSPRKF